MKYELYAPQFQLSLTHVSRTRGAGYTAVRGQGQLTTMLGLLHPSGGTVSVRCCVSVVAQQYGMMADGCIMMRLIEV